MEGETTVANFVFELVYYCRRARVRATVSIGFIGCVMIALKSLDAQKVILWYDALLPHSNRLPLLEDTNFQAHASITL